MGISSLMYSVGEILACCSVLMKTDCSGGAGGALEQVTVSQSFLLSLSKLVINRRKKHLQHRGGGGA